MRSRQIRLTVRHLMIGVAFIGFRIWSEQTRRRWAKYHDTFLFFCELETETLELLNGPYGPSDGYAYGNDEIGEQFGITAERVAEIERRSVETLGSGTGT